MIPGDALESTISLRATNYVSLYYLGSELKGADPTARMVWPKRKKKYSGV